jgi:hypothetical protein
MFSFLGNLAGAASSISSIASLGKGLFGSKKKALSPAAQAVNQAHLQGELQKDYWDTSMAMSKKHKVHPLVALGVGSPSGGVVSEYDPGDIKGQNLERAARAGIPGRANQELEKLAVERAQLENDILRAQLTNINSSPSDPAHTTVAAGSNEPAVVHQPTQRAYHEKSDPSTIYGANAFPLPASDRIVTQSGHVIRSMSKDAKELLEDDPEAYVQMVVHDRWLPAAKKAFSKKTFDSYRWLFREILNNELEKARERKRRPYSRPVRGKPYSKIHW